MTGLRRALVSPFAVGLWVAMAIALAVIGLRSLGWLESWELWAYDSLLRFDRGEPHEQDQLVVIEVTDKNIESLRWPLRDETVARALEILLSYKPAVIGVDIYRSEDNPPGQEALAAVLTGYQNIIAIKKFPNTETDVEIAPPKSLAGTERVGFSDILVDRDGLVRRGLLFLDEGDKPSYSFALRLALSYLARSGIVPRGDGMNNLVLGANRIPPLERADGGYAHNDPKGYQFLLDHRNAKRRVKSYDLAMLLAGGVRAKAIESKIVLLGVVSDSVKDDFYVPVATKGQDRSLIRGVELHATIVGQLLRLAKGSSSTLTPISVRWQWLFIFACALIATQTYWIRSPFYQPIAIVAGLLLLGVVGLVAYMRSFWIPMVHPILAWLGVSTALLVYGYREVKAERAQVLQLFGTFVSEKVRDALWSRRTGFIDGDRPRPEDVTATVLFTDLVDFTKIAEKGRTPAQLMVWLNEYMEGMVPCVEQHGGFVKQYAGDAIMALFGLPKYQPAPEAIREAAVNSIRCALAMQAAMTALNGRWRGQKAPTVAMRIGISTGPMVVGSLGSQRRMEYAVVGDTVNTAARLESFDKDTFASHPFENPCRILIEETTQHLVKDLFDLKFVCEAPLKGKDNRIKVYQVLGEANDSRK